MREIPDIMKILELASFKNSLLIHITYKIQKNMFYRTQVEISKS